MSQLLTPMDFANGQQAHNRLWLAPMTNMQSHADGTLSDDEFRWLKARSEGGFSVIESCATHVSLDGQGWQGELGIWDDAQIPGWRRLADAMHGDESLLIAQIFHGGARALRSAEFPTPWSSSSAGEGDSAVAGGTVEQIVAARDAFIAAGVRAYRAGLDGIELHGAHGYLLCQFLSTTMNQRTDEWGGSLENRARLTREILQEIRRQTSPEFIIGVRLSSESYGSTAGLHIDETAQVAQWLCADSADFIHISLWDASRNSTQYPDQHPTRFFRDALPAAVPLITAGAIWTRDDAQRQLDLGADAVALGRSAIANPDWPLQVATGKSAPLRPPVTEQQLRDRALGESFVQYMKRWPGFVAG